MMAAYTHILIKKTAKEMAGAFYEHAAHDNEFYRHFPKVNAFVSKWWGRFVPIARDTLTTMLAQPGVSEHEKQRIFDALVNERSLPSDTRVH